MTIDIERAREIADVGTKAAYTVTITSLRNLARAYVAAVEENASLRAEVERLKNEVARLEEELADEGREYRGVWVNEAKKRAAVEAEMRELLDTVEVHDAVKAAQALGMARSRAARLRRERDEARLEAHASEDAYLAIWSYSESVEGERDDVRARLKVEQAHALQSITRAEAAEAEVERLKREHDAAIAIQVERVQHLRVENDALRRERDEALANGAEAFRLAIHHQKRAESADARVAELKAMLRSSVEGASEAVINLLGARGLLPSHHEIPSQQEIIDEVFAALAPAEKCPKCEWRDGKRSQWCVTCSLENPAEEPAPPKCGACGGPLEYEDSTSDWGCENCGNRVPDHGDHPDAE